MANPITGSMTLDLTSTLRKRWVADEIFKKYPDRAPLLQLLMGQKRVTSGSREFEHLEQEMDPTTVTVTAVPNGTSITFSVADSKIIPPGMVLRKNASIAAIVTAVDTGTGIATVDDSTGFAVGDTPIRCASTRVEGSAEPSPFYRLPDVITNVVETVRDTYGQTGWVETEEYWGGESRQWHHREDALMAHKIGLENTIWLSKYSKTATISSAALYHTRGLVQRIVTNVGSFDNGIVTWNQMRQAVAEYTRLMTAPEFYLFVSRDVSSIIDQVAYEKITPAAFVKEFGVGILKLILGNKVCKVVVVDCFQGAMNSVMVGLDLSQVSLITCKDQQSGKVRWMRETVRGPEITGADATVGGFLTDIGAKLLGENAAFIMTNALSA